MGLHAVAATCCMFVLQASAMLITGSSIYNKEIISVPGTKISFVCPVNCTKHLPVWSLHGNILSDGLKINPSVIQKPRLSVQQNCGEETVNLVISNITKGDEGTYCCEYLLMQHCAALELTELKIHTDENNTLHGVAGENFSFVCTLTKAMKGVHLKVVYNHSIVAAATSNRLNVTFNATKELHDRQVTCIAVFDAMNISLETNVTLNISYKPAIKIKLLSSPYFTAGENASFICSYDSNPNPVSISWKKDGRVVSRNETVVITNIARTDAGQYQCFVDNGKFLGEDSIQIFVLYKLVVNIIASPDKRLTEGNKLVLVCTHDSNLQASITWIRHGVSVSSNSFLVIHKVSTNDSGLYQCIVNTTHGYGADAITIIVIYRNKEESGDIPASEQFSKEMVYYLVAAAVVLVLLLFITWKLYKYRKFRSMEIERTNETIIIQESTNTDTNRNVERTNRPDMQPEDDRSSSNYEAINENEMLPNPGSSISVVVEKYDVSDLRRHTRQSEIEDGESEIDTSSSSDSQSVPSSETARYEQDIIESSGDDRLSDNTELISNMANEGRNPYFPLIRNEMEYLNSYSALRIHSNEEV